MVETRLAGEGGVEAATQVVGVVVRRCGCQSCSFLEMTTNGDGLFLKRTKALSFLAV